MPTILKEYPMGAKAMAPILAMFPDHRSIVMRVAINGYIIAAEIKPNIITLTEPANERF